MYQRTITASMDTDNQGIQQDSKNGISFFHYAAKEDHFYFIICKMIFQNFSFLDEHGYDHGFFYQSSNYPATNYYVMCKLCSHVSIVNILNNEMDINNINSLKRVETLSLEQKFDLEQDLKQILPSHFMQYNNVPERVESDKNMSPRTAIKKRKTDNPTGYTYPQQVDLSNNFSQHHIIKSDMRPKYDVNTNSFHTMTRQVISTTDINQNYSKNDSPGNNYFTHQDVMGVAEDWKRVDLDNFPQHSGEAKLVYDGNTPNSLHRSIGDNVVTTQSVSMTNTCQNYDENGDDYITHQEVGRYTHNVTQSHIDNNNDNFDDFPHQNYHFDDASI